jgi:hypothetical protein
VKDSPLLIITGSGVGAQARPSQRFLYCKITYCSPGGQSKDTVVLFYVPLQITTPKVWGFITHSVFALLHLSECGVGKMAQLRAKSVWILHLCCLGSSNSESLIGPQFVAASSACTPGARAKNCLFVCRCEWFGWSLRGGKYPRFIQACSLSHVSNDHVQDQDSPMDFERAARIISLCHLPFNELLYPHTQLVHSRLAASFQRGRFRHWG